MLIELLCSMVTDNRAFDKGEVVEWPDKLDAERMVKRGVAKPAKQPGAERSK